MIHRLLAMCIVGFWLAMTGLLVVRELYPESTNLNAVPVSHVARVFFQHQQSSDLYIHTARDQIGSIHIQPRPIMAPDRREMDVQGGVSVSLPNGRPQRFSWAGRIEMDSQFSIRRFHVDFATQEPSRRLFVRVDLAARTANFATKLGDRTLDETAITLDEAGFRTLMVKAKIDPSLLLQFKSAESELPRFELTAQASSTVLGGEKLSTYLLVLKAGHERILEAHVSQLGQVLTAQAPLLGLKLLPQGTAE